MEVTNCTNCPLCNSDDYGYSCNHPNSKVQEEEMTTDDKRGAPSKCPLRLRSFFIYLKIPRRLEPEPVKP